MCPWVLHKQPLKKLLFTVFIKTDWNSNSFSADTVMLLVIMLFIKEQLSNQSLNFLFVPPCLGAWGRGREEEAGSEGSREEAKQEGWLGIRSKEELQRGGFGI